MKKTFTITVKESTIGTNNNGFDLIELLGALEFAVMQTKTKLAKELQTAKNKEE